MSHNYLDPQQTLPNHLTRQLQPNKFPTFSSKLPLSKINENPSQQEQQTSFSKQTEQGCCNKQKVWTYFYSWLLFLIAFIVYLLIWIIGHFSIQRVTSYFYFTQFNISPYANIQFWKQSMRAANLTQEKYVLSTQLYTNDQLKRADSIVLSLVFSWVMWKLPLTIFTLIVIKQKNHAVLRYSTWGFYLFVLLLVDILTTIFKLEGYRQWIFFVIYFGLSLVTIVVNGVTKRKRLLNNLKNYLLPILYIVLAYVCFAIFVPGIYKGFYHAFGQDAPYMIVYFYPVIDLIFYSMIIAITYYCSSHCIKFIKMLQFLNTGYAVGHIILFYPEDVQFYYLVTYFVIRNLTFNWVIQPVQKYVINPVPLFGWIMIYLVSLSINFIPFVAVGKLVVSSSFYSQILLLTLPILGYNLPKEYYAYELSHLPQMWTFNAGLKSNTALVSVFIIWVLFSISQKYHISRPELKEIFFYILGIYLFYFGLVTGSQLYYLQSNSL